VVHRFELAHAVRLDLDVGTASVDSADADGLLASADAQPGRSQDEGPDQSVPRGDHRGQPRRRVPHW
jgi:hypothetical protein